MIRKYHITNCRQTHDTARKNQTLGRQIKQSNHLSLSHQDDLHKDIEQLQTPAMGVTIYNKSTATEPPP